MNDKSVNAIVNWKDLNLSQSDLDFIYNYLLEKEVPMTSWELSKAIIDEHIRLFRRAPEKRKISRAGLQAEPGLSNGRGDTLSFIR